MTPQAPSPRPPAPGWVWLAAEQRARGALAAWLSVVAGFVVLNVAAAAVVFDDVSDRDGLEDLDRPVLDAAIEARTPFWDSVVTVYSELGGPVVAIAATFLAVVGLSLLWRTWTPFLLMLLAGSGSLAMSMTSKGVVGRQRPDQVFAVTPVEPSFSFPSGHALNATIIAGVLAYLLVSRTRSGRVALVVVPLALAHTLLMGLSRVYLGAHWLTDVVVAWPMSFAWLALVLTGHQVLVHLRERRRGRPGAAATVTA
ncbi:phosphatase PAP2 family protein [Aquipuribacter hungaricus]|uniref:Phosphatase PAP2 family protein n=1 Tax=Aquipuribacter hungaricus TaxID=545624 RepID=A0ABV7WK21_9MICO